VNEVSSTGGMGELIVREKIDWQERSNKMLIVVFIFLPFLLVDEER
jgi:hypothetical protein